MHDGIFASNTEIPLVKNEVDLSTSASALLAQTIPADFELNLYAKISLGDGKQANNPWLQELPDPITRTTWDNYMTISAADAVKLGLENWNVSDGALNGSVVTLKVNGVTLKKCTGSYSARSGKRIYWFGSWLWKNSRNAKGNDDGCKCFCFHA